MSSGKIIMGFVLVGIVVSLYYMFAGGDNAKAYIDEILKERKDKDEFMRNADSSPFASDNSTFQGLKYFVPDIKYRISADLSHVSIREKINLSTNDGQSQSYIPYGWAEFDLDNLHNKLLILEIAEGEERGKLFLAFADQTSANETYGAGRYLDINKTPGAKNITLDFNAAYNPYCAYSDKFSCPLPPKENILKVSIKAGEKSYH